MSTLVTVRLRNSAAAEQLAWLSLRVRRRDDQQVHFDAEVAAAMARGALNIMGPLTESQAKVMKAEIVGGILMARKQAGRVGFVAELVGLGGSIAGEDGLVAIPSVAFAVAAQLAVIQGLGVEDLRAKPHGGFGWKLDSIEVVEAPAAP
jgi:hypothetical protein